jgi:hypothetical protein
MIERIIDVISIVTAVFSALSVFSLLISVRKLIKLRSEIKHNEISIKSRVIEIEIESAKNKINSVKKRMDDEYGN